MRAFATVIIIFLASIIQAQSVGNRDLEVRAYFLKMRSGGKLFGGATEGPWKEYHANGKLWIEGNLNDGKIRQKEK
jgi:hypothetical protein